MISEALKLLLPFLHETYHSIEKVLQKVWKEVLNLPLEAVSIDKPFTRLGGDSITAMQVSSKCRAQKISVAAVDILQAGTIRKLATRCKSMDVLGALTQNEAEISDDCREFELAPIQAKFFQMFPEGLDHFNQSFFMNLKHNHPTKSLTESFDGRCEQACASSGKIRSRFVGLLATTYRRRLPRLVWIQRTSHLSCKGCLEYCTEASKAVEYPSRPSVCV